MRSAFGTWSAYGPFGRAMRTLFLSTNLLSIVSRIGVTAVTLKSPIGFRAPSSSDIWGERFIGKGVHLSKGKILKIKFVAERLVNPRTFVLHSDFWVFGAGRPAGLLPTICQRTFLSGVTETQVVGRKTEGTNGPLEKSMEFGSTQSESKAFRK